jgi:hypothetical protein
MSVDTDGFIATDFKDVLVICTIAEGALKRLIAVRRRAEFPKNGRTADALARFKSPTMTLRPADGMVTISFTCDGESRAMNLHLTTDSDHLKHAPKSIAVSMGASGGSETYIRTVLHALSVFGPAWYDANDCDVIDAAPLELPRPTVLGLVAVGQLSPYHFENMRDTLRGAAGGSERAYLEMVGCSDAEARQFDHIEDHTVRWDSMHEFAKKSTDSANEPTHRARRPRP